MHLLKNDILNSKPSKIADNISKSEREALQTLINRTDIVIKPADKGKATVILITDDYKKECYRQLNDSKFFLRKLDDLKELPPGSLLVTLDVSSLYTNIPHKEGIEACRKLSTPLAIFPAPVSKPNPFVT